MDIGSLFTGAAILIAGILIGIGLSRNSKTANQGYDKLLQEFRELKAHIKR